MASLSLLIPARQEMFLLRTIQDALANLRGDTEILAVLDGAWADPPIPDDPRVHLIYHPESIGQRAATNEAARISRADFVAKFDAHCAFDEGFDVKLMQPYVDGELGRDVTTIPRMFNLHAFDWMCDGCGHRTYQGPQPTACVQCQGASHHREIVWKPRLNRGTDFARFDNTLHFQYFSSYKHRAAAQGDLADVMCHVGAGWMMRRDRYWELGGMDERHGSWGQMGVEVSCKSWLSGGRQVVNKRTWFSHLFRTQPGFGFPYHMSERQAEAARQYSRKLWLENTWRGQVRPLSWLLEKFWPVPDWTDEDLGKLREKAQSFAPKVAKTPTKGIVFYTDNRLDPVIASAVKTQLLRSLNGHRLVTVSLQPLEFGQNLVLPLERSRLSMFKQILAGLEALDTDIVFLCEHDVVYHPSHFDFTPPRQDVYYYNENVYKVDSRTGQAVFYWTKQVSGLCAYRSLLLDHYRRRVAVVEAQGYDHALGYEPGCHPPPRGLDAYVAERYMSEVPIVDIRHRHNLTQTRWDPSQFRNKATCQGWTLCDEIPGWGRTKDRMGAWLQERIAC